MASLNRCPAMEDLLSFNRCLLGSSASAKGIFLDGFSKIPSRIPSRNGKFPYKWRFWWENMFWTAFSYELERWLRVWRKWGTAKHHKASHGKVWLPKLQHCEFWWGYTSRPNWAPDLGKQAPLRKTTFPISQTFKIRASLFLPKLTPMSGSPEGWQRKTDSFWSYLLDMLQLDSLLLFIWAPKKVWSHMVAHPLCKLYAFVPCFKETSPDSSNFQAFFTIIWRWVTPISHRKKYVYGLAANITEFVACCPMLKPWRKIATGHALLGLPLHWLSKSRWLPAANHQWGELQMILAVGIDPFGNFHDRF